MPASGLLALLDDIATIADDVAAMAAMAAKKGAAAADDVGALTTLAAKKTAGVVTDDMAVTAEQAIGIARERELPVVFAVARGSFINKCVFLTPGALVLNLVAPWAILPILMAGGAFLCFEGVEKVLHKVRGHEDGHGGAGEPEVTDPAEFEKMRVSGAIRTDLILSGEIIAISLGEVKSEPFLTQTLTLYAISVIMTVGVYGVVGLLVKLDDMGEAIAKRGGPGKALGGLILAGTPKLLHAISIIGTVAMLMVGGHILLEGIKPLEHLVHDLTASMPGLLGTLVGIAADIAVGVVGGLLVVGAIATGIPGKIAALFRKKKG